MSVRRHPLPRYLLAAVLGTVIAAALVGAAEAVHIVRAGSVDLARGLGTVLYGLGLYGLLALPVGVLAGLLLRRLSRRIPILAVPAYAGGVAALLTLTGGGAVVGTFRFMRDGGLAPPLALLAGVGLGLGAGLVAGHVVRLLLSRLPRISAATLLVILVAAVAGQRLTASEGRPARDAPGRATAERPNVVLVVADTLRADSLGSYSGKTPSPTPHLDAFAAESIRFDRMYANSSWTRPAVASIHTGLLPRHHTVVSKVSALPEDLPTLATVLHEAGYATAASVTNVNLAPDFGFGRGFEAYRYHAPVRPFGAAGPAVRLSAVNVARLVEERLSRALVPERFYGPAEAVNATAARLLDDLGDGPFFLWVHYMDPHDPFFHRPLDGTGIARVRTPHPPPEWAERMKSLYAGDVHHWDAAFGALMDELERRGLLDHTWVVLTADHGEEFQDHGGFWHGQTLFDELTRVPLIVRPPGGTQGPKVDHRLASQVDILPTLLARVGVAPPPRVDGIDLFAEESGGETARSVVMEVDHDGMVLSGVVWDRYKYVRANPGNWRGLPEEALYDLVADPKEHRNLASERPGRTREIAALLDQRAPAAGGDSDAHDRSVEIDSALQEDLKALGYIQ